MVDPYQDVPMGSGGQFGEPVGAPGFWTQPIENVIAADILPLSPPPLAGTPGGDDEKGAILTQLEVEAFVRLILDNDQAAALDVARRAMAAAGGRAFLLGQLLTRAARHLGWLWEQDLCDFVDVTLGTHRLDRLMKETEFADGQRAELHHHRHRALLLPAPGEQHCFGVAMVAEVFRAGGWRVRTGAAVARDRLVRLVREEWFDIVGLGISSERALGGIAACVRALRQASRNNRLLIILGGHAIIGFEERSRFLGADMTAIDAYQALEDGNMMMATLQKREDDQRLRQFTLT